MTGIIWSVVLAGVGLVGIWLTGKYNSWGWALGLGAQVLWAVYAVTTGQYGFLVSAVVFGAIYAKNWAAWRRTGPAVTAATACQHCSAADRTLS